MTKHINSVKWMDKRLKIWLCDVTSSKNHLKYDTMNLKSLQSFYSRVSLNGKEGMLNQYYIIHYSLSFFINYQQIVTKDFDVSGRQSLWQETLFNIFHISFNFGIWEHRGLKISPLERWSVFGRPKVGIPDSEG